MFDDDDDGFEDEDDLDIDESLEDAKSSFMQKQGKGRGRKAMVSRDDVEDDDEFDDDESLEEAKSSFMQNRGAGRGRKAVVGKDDDEFDDDESLEDAKSSFMQKRGAKRFSKANLRERISKARSVNKQSGEQNDDEIRGDEDDEHGADHTAAHTLPEDSTSKKETSRSKEQAQTDDKNNNSNKSESTTQPKIKKHAPIDHLHIGRSVRRPIIEPQEMSQYTKIASKFHRKWNKDPWQHARQDFEFDGLQQIHKLSWTYQVLLEIRNATVPGSSHHPSFTRLARHREHIICYTHADVLDIEAVERISTWTQQAWPKAKIVFVDSRETRSDSEVYEELRETVIDTLEEKGSQNSTLTVGLPNVGKSSAILGMLRATGKNVKMRVSYDTKKVTKRKPSIRDVPGHTRDLSQYVLRDNPRLYCLDVPGICPPPLYFQNRPQAWFALAAANCLPIQSLEDMDGDLLMDLCEYVLHCLNRDRVFDYVKVCMCVLVCVFVRVWRSAHGYVLHCLNMDRVFDYVKMGMYVLVFVCVCVWKSAHGFVRVCAALFE